MFFSIPESPDVSVAPTQTSELRPSTPAESMEAEDSKTEAEAAPPSAPEVRTLAARKAYDEPLDISIQRKAREEIDR